MTTMPIAARRALSRPACRGSVLVVVLAVLIVLTSMALSFAYAMRTEAAIGANEVAEVQADQVARGALAYLRAILEDQDGTLPDDTELQAEAVPVGDAGYFWLLKPNPDEPDQWAYGLIDEAGKLNLNTATLDMLAALPGMDPDLAAGIVDWRDPDDEPEQGGAEGQYYLLQPDPYRAKNDRLETVEELLSIKDMTPLLLYGEDANRNGRLEAWEVGAEQFAGGTFRVGADEPGIAALTTVYSRQPAPPTGDDAPLDVNGAPPAQIAQALGEALDAARVGPTMALIVTNRPFANFIDLHYRANLQIEESRLLLDRLRVGNTASSEGLVNLNSAPAAVLASLPELEAADAQLIVDRRLAQGTFDDILVLTEILPREKAIAIGGVVTTRTYACSAQIVATDAGGRGLRRVHAVFDLRSGTPEVVYFRDLTSLGWPLDSSILESLRAGGEPVAASGSLAGRSGGMR